MLNDSMIPNLSDTKGEDKVIISYYNKTIDGLLQERVTFYVKLGKSSKL